MTQITLLIITVIIVGAVIFIYPDPYAAFLPQGKNRLLTRAVLVSSGGGLEHEAVFLVGDVEISLDLVTSGGLRHVLTSKTNSSGVAELKINSGYYRISFGDWWSGYILINRPMVMNVTKYVVEKRPSSTDIFSLSKNWTISQGDVIEASFKNTLGYPVQLEAVNIGDKELFRGRQEIASAVEWRGRYTVPSDVSIPWSNAGGSLNIALQISYTEVSVNS